ncbi:MAG TPA: hypothetical protein VLZ81_01545, partial [Blastocatellia bacterium]|nr:hypothetical protein [Blastocatellia bacterium]
QPLTVKLDPRVTIPPISIAQQFSLSMKCYKSLYQLHDAMVEVKKLREALQPLRKQTENSAIAAAASALDKRADQVGGKAVDIDIDSDIMYAAIRGSRPGEETMSSVQAGFVYLMVLMQSADAAPTTQAVSSLAATEQQNAKIMGQWKLLKEKDVPVLNALLTRVNMTPIVLK